MIEEAVKKSAAHSNHWGNLFRFKYCRLRKNVLGSTICNSQQLETNRRQYDGYRNNKLRPVHTMEYYTALKMDELGLPCWSSG